MKFLLLILSISCDTVLVQQVINHINELIISTKITAILFLTFSIFLLTRGLRYKFLSVSSLIALIITSTYELILPYINNGEVLNYVKLVSEHKYLFVLTIFALAYILLNVFDFIIYILYLYLLYMLYDLLAASYSAVILNVIFILAAFILHFYVEDTRNIFLAALFSVIGSFVLLLSSEYLLDKDFGYMEIYLKYLQGQWNDEMIAAIGVQGVICILSCLIQLSYSNK